MTRMLRSDARDNRDRVIEAARELFAESGLDVTMREIARRAEVGPATLYRRFPTKQDLVLDAFRDEVDACRRTVHDGAADPDAVRGLRRTLEALLIRQAGNQGFTTAFLSTRSEDIGFREHRAEMVAALRGMVSRARQQGGLRDDVRVEDVILVLHAARGLAGVSARRRTAAARRFASIALDGLVEDPALSPSDR